MWGWPFFYSFSEIISPSQKLYGTDINEPCVNWCKENLPFAHVDKNDLLPPLKYDDNYFSFIYASSVFSHLPFEYQLIWSIEIYRCLSPGGCFLFSTHGTTFFPVIYKRILKSKNNESSVISLGECGLFLCNEPVSENDIGQREIASAFNKDAVTVIFPFFELILHVPCSKLAGAQDTYVLKTKLRESPVLFLKAKKPDDFVEPMIVNSTKGIHSEHVEFEFEANGQNKFHSLVIFSNNYFGKTTAGITIHDNQSNLIYSKQINVASSQVMGQGNYYILAFDTDELIGKFKMKCTFNGMPVDVTYTIIRPILF